MPGKRRAHYLSRFFMAGFTPSGRRDDLLHVWSKKQGRSWKAQAEAVAHQRDLFRPEGPQFAQDEFEDGFAAIESEVAPILRRTINCEVLPEEEELEPLLHLVALNAVRPPAEIAALEESLDEILRKQLVDRLTPEMHDDVLQGWKAEGRDTTHVEDLEALKARILVGNVRAKVRRDPLLVMGVIGRAAALVEIFARRSWTLLRTEQGAEFICSDRPVSLLNNRNVSPRTQARYDHPLFDVIMPLSRRLCLIGHYYRQSGSAVASTATVGFINFITKAGASDFVFSSSESYPLVSEDDGGAEVGTAYRRDLAQAS